MSIKPETWAQLDPEERKMFVQGRQRVTELLAREEQVDHPAHYGGAEDPFEAIKVIEAWKLGFCLGNTVKYISRAGKKDRAKHLEDLKKARWYLDREIQNLEKKDGD